MKNKFRYLRITLLLAAISAVVFVNGGLNFDLNKTAYAVGELTVDWGVPSGDPIFVVDNTAPGDPCETRTVNVLNSSAISREVAVRGEKTDENNNLANALEIEIIKVGTGTIYGPESLEQFFTDSESANAIFLSNQTSGQDFDYEFKVCFPETAGNEFQDANVEFDLHIGVNVPIPEDCVEENFSNTIFGTAGNDRIRGTGASELIFGLEGNDRIEGGGGNDCIVGGDGNDKIEGGTGEDIVVGGIGDDEIDGGSDNDLVFGGEGNDKLKGGSGLDQVFGDTGEDQIDGGSGNDELHGGDQNDSIEGSSGLDQVFGEAGNDSLKGGSDDDLLDGGPGGGTLNGESGTDRCINGVPKIKCEILI